MSIQNIEKLFKETFSGFEADVNPNAWTNISQGLQAPAPSNHIPDGSSASKTMGLWNKAGLFLAISAAVILAVIYFPQKKSADEIATVKNTPSVVQENSTAVATKPAALKMIDAPALENAPAEKKTSNQKQTEPKFAAAKLAVENSDNAKEKEVIVNSSPAISPVASVDAVSPKEKNPVPEKTVTTEVTSLKANTSTVISNTQIISTDFNLLLEPTENNAPREQEARSDFAFYIPNVFTPNNDRVNEDFKPMGLHFKDYELVIYDNKWNEIFRSIDIEHRWDGKLKDGTLAPAGNYVYMINVKDLNNVEHPQRGLLLLKR